jgi:PPOX class probable F420-dependent enzyme
MPKEITEPARALLTGANIAHLATLMPDGTPHVTPVWVDVEDSTVLVNSAEGRVKVENLKRDPRVGLSVADGENPYLAVSIRGRVREITGDGAEEHIDALAQTYLGEETYPMRQPGERRVLIKIEPEHVFGPPAG